MVVTRPPALVKVIRRAEALYELWEVLPFTVADSINDVRLSGSCGFDKVAVRERDSLRVNPDGVLTIVLEVYGVCIPKRGSASSAVVSVVPSG